MLCECTLSPTGKPVELHLTQTAANYFLFTVYLCRKTRVGFPIVGLKDAQTSSWLSRESNITTFIFFKILVMYA